MFSTLINTDFNFLVTFILSFANAFDLYLFKNLLVFFFVKGKVISYWEQFFTVNFENMFCKINMDSFDISVHIKKFLQRRKEQLFFSVLITGKCSWSKRTESKIFSNFLWFDGHHVFLLECVVFIVMVSDYWPMKISLFSDKQRNLYLSVVDVVFVAFVEDNASMSSVGYFENHVLKTEGSRSH